MSGPPGLPGQLQHRPGAAQHRPGPIQVYRPGQPATDRLGLPGQYRLAATSLNLPTLARGLQTASIDIEMPFPGRNI